MLFQINTRADQITTVRVRDTDQGYAPGTVCAIEVTEANRVHASAWLNAEEARMLGESLLAFARGA